MKELIEQIYLALQTRQFHKLPKLQEELLKIDISSFTKEEKDSFLEALNEIQNIVNKQKKEISQAMERLSNAKNYLK